MKKFYTIIKLGFRQFVVLIKPLISKLAGYLLIKVKKLPKTGQQNKKLIFLRIKACRVNKLSVTFTENSRKLHFSMKRKSSNVGKLVFEKCRVVSKNGQNIKYFTIPWAITFC